jgi:hypothetical protein
MSDSPNQYKLGEVIKKVYQRYQLEDKVLEAEIYARWEQLAGAHVNNRTREIKFKAGKLTVFLNSASLRQELSLRKGAMMEYINDRLELRPVKELELR